MQIDIYLKFIGKFQVPQDEPTAEEMAEEEKQKYFTFVPAEDFFVKGDCTGATLPENGAFQWMQDNYDDCYKVTTIDKYEDILPHFEVGGV